MSFLSSASQQHSRVQLEAGESQYFGYGGGQPLCGVEAIACNGLVGVHSVQHEIIPISTQADLYFRL